VGIAREREMVPLGFPSGRTPLESTVNMYGGREAGREPDHIMPMTGLSDMY